MEPASIAELQVLLEGVPLPAERSALLNYALRQGAIGEQVATLQRLPERGFETIDEVAEELVSVQPPRERDVPHTPREESGDPPGGDAYARQSPERGAVRA